MKGSLNSGDTRLWHALMQALCPDLPYAYNSGGDPQEIPSLTYKQLLHFHETYYHPSRCLFFFYGNLPLQGHLDFISEQALKNISRAPSLPPIKHQERFSTPLSKELSYAINETDDPQKKTLIAFGWLTAPIEDQHAILALSILDSILMDTDASLLKAPLLASGLCTQVSAFIDTDMSEAPYVIVCKGCEKEQGEALKKILLTTLEEIILKGIPSHLVDTALHQQEFERSEITGEHAPFGLTLFMRSALAKQHNCPPENALMIHSLFEKLLEQVKDPRYLPGILKKHLLDNPHFVQITMTPDKTLLAKEQEEEKKCLQEIQSKLSEIQIQNIQNKTKELAHYQKAAEKQCIECLPKISVDAIPPQVRSFTLQEQQCRNLHVFHHEGFTNHIVYADLIFDFATISEDDLPYVQLMLSLLGEVGVGARDYKANLEYIQTHTGGLSASSALYVQTTAPYQMRPCLILKGKALARKADKLFSLLAEISTSLRFDEKKRIKDLLAQLYTALQNKLNRNALRYAIQHALSGFSTPSHISEAWNGLSYYYTIKELLSDLESNLPKVIDKLSSLKEKLFCSKNPQLVLSCDLNTYEHLHQKDFFGLADLPQKEFVPWQPHYPLALVPSQARLIPSPVAFTCEAFKTITYTHPAAPFLSIATHLLDNIFLHSKVREQGGAYGVGAHFAPMLGHFYFHAYRDPHIAQTLTAFHNSIESLAKGSFSSRDLEEAKLGVIQQLDVPLAPAARAMAAYSWLREGKTQAMRQTYRDQVLAATPKDIQQAVESELLPKKESGVVVTFADGQLIERENKFLAQKGCALVVKNI